MKIVKSVKFKGIEGEELVAFITGHRKPEVYICEDWDDDAKVYKQRAKDEIKEFGSSGYTEDETRTTNEVKTLDQVLDHDYFLRVPLEAIKKMASNK